MRNFLNGIMWLIKLGLLVLLAGTVTIYYFLWGSLPQLDGQYLSTYLNADVKVERDAQGIPTIYAKERKETAFALGFLHAQERFFQMDLLRRRAAGELAELLGDSQLEADALVRQHRFKQRAKKILAELPQQHIRILQAYTYGVNSGLEALSNPPFEYLLLGLTPHLWEMEDSLLGVYSMYLELNNHQDIRERSLALMKDLLPQEWYAFLTPQGGEWDAPLEGNAYPNVTKLPSQPMTFSIGHLDSPNLPATQLRKYTNPDYHQKPLAGSNNWAVTGLLSPYRSALLANDIHLPLREPNIWYRASWFLQDGRRVTGVTLPGMPVMVVGSNENIAWGFTNSYGDWGDIIPLTMNDNNTRYLTDEGWQHFSIYSETINSSSGKQKQVINIESIWGPVIGKDHQGRLLSYQWLAHSAQAVNLELLELEKTNTTWEAIRLAPQMGMPPQNLLLADHKGNIAWTIAGAIPERDSIQTKSQQISEASKPWSSKKWSSKKWSGYLAGKDYPRIVNPANQRLWTANNRVTSGKDLEKIRFDGGDLGARAQQIRETLFSTDAFSESDFFAIQMDNRALLMQRWADLLKTVVQDFSWQEPIEPSASEKEPSALQQEPSALQQEPSAANNEPSVAINEPSAGNEESSTGNEESSTGNEESSAGNEESSTGNEESSTGSEEPLAGNDKSSVGETKLSAEENSVLAKINIPLITTNQSTAMDKDLAEIKSILTDNPLTADKNSLDYLLVKTFRNQIINQTIGWIYDAMERYYPENFRRSAVDTMIEYPVWNLISQSPDHLIPAGFNSWDEFIQTAARETYHELAMSSLMPVSQQTWGEYNTLSIQHPFSMLKPRLSPFLDMAEVPMSGDNHMPNVYNNKFGASMRMVVSPGYEANGIMQMPTGQSGHPLSSYYSRGHQDWVEGKPDGFLPSETEWTLLLKAK
jgi:penicillin amidase